MSQLIVLVLLFRYFALLHAYDDPTPGGRNPPLENVGKFKPVATSVKDTCGYQRSTDYCAAAGNADGINNGACIVKICNQRCPGRDRKSDTPPRYINMLDSDPGPCVTRDYLDSKNKGTPSYQFFNDPTCKMVPRSVPRLGQPSQFTLTIWIKQAKRNAGVLFEKIAGPGRYKQLVMTLMVGDRAVMLQYRGLDARSHYKMFPVFIPPERWSHLTIQVYQVDVSIFINGSGPAITDKLPIPILDNNVQPVIRIGQRVRATDQFVGRIQDYRWYDIVLSNREIEKIATGNFPELNIQSYCICPAGTPRISPINERYCIRNGVEDNNVSNRVLRLNANAHPLGYLNDGDLSTTWISRPDLYMPGGITINIDLENGEYQIFYIKLHFYNSQPKAITFSRNSTSTDGEIEAWGYLADDCMLRFKHQDNGELRFPYSTSCQQFEEDVPYMNGNVTFDLLVPPPNARPGFNNFYGTPELMDFVEATKVQLRFANQYYTINEDISTKHQYYGVREVEIIGRCNCHGHATSCDVTQNPYQCECLEESNTDGHMCQRCKPLYNNKMYRIGDTNSPYNCQKCDCNQHADSCHYEAQFDPHPEDFYSGGGGVCDDCKHHTTGRHCEKCETQYFRKEGVDLDAPDLCSPCNCHRGGAVNESQECEEVGGQCSCKERVTSRRCNICIDGFYNLRKINEQGCDSCSCFLMGTVNRTFTCNQRTGKCLCKKNVKGRTCSECEYDYKNLTDENPDGCEPCNCSKVGAVGQSCDSTSGQCHCRDNIEGMLCDQCKDGFWDLSDTGCRSCACDSAGSEPGTICDKVTGQCVCKANTQGRTCNECIDEYYNLNAGNRQGCEFCSCDARGTLNGSLVCDKISGECSCKENVDGRVCNLCKGNTFGLRKSLEKGCEACNCDPMGTSLGQELEPHELVCDANSGQCACLPSREGRRCDQCSPGFYLPSSNETGCLVCDCHPVGSTSQVCNNVTGMCPCKPEESGAGLAGRRCDQCAETYWNFHTLFGRCEPCGCDEAGSEDDVCNFITGQCRCKSNVVGEQCDTCREGSSHLSASNPMGCYSHPEQQAAPTETNVTSREISLTWNPPDYPNGDLLTYRLYRNDEVIYNITDESPLQSHSYSDVGLLPYTEYIYIIETSNIGGSASSPELRVRTLSGVPTGVPPLEVTNILSRQATFLWAQPEVAHGPIETYVLQSVTPNKNDRVTVHYEGLSTQTTVTDLLPFTNYTFTLRACTSGGCGDSLPATVVTLEAKPQDQLAPTVAAVSNTSLHVSWEPPVEANGIINSYEVMMRGKPGPDGVHRPLQERVFRDYGAYNPRSIPSPFYNALEPPGSNFTLGRLQPFKEYEFLVSSSNRLGSAESPWTTGRTLEGTPVFMPAPRLIPVSAFEINITWATPDPVTEVRGEVTMYQVILTRNNTSGNPYGPPTEDAVIYSCGPSVHHFVATGFEPYSTHKITMKLCNSVSCVLSEPSNATTLPAAPKNQAPPTAVHYGISLDLTWENPEHVNGPQPLFTLMKSDVSFSTPPIDMTKGVRFPGISYVTFPSSILPRDASYTGIELTFKTFQSDALLFFSAAFLSQGIRDEYVVIQLRDGRPWFLFDAQNNPTAVTTDNDDNRRYNDGKWHRIEANRFNKDGYIEVDLIYTGSKTSSGSTTVIGSNDGVFIGGIPPDYEVGRPNDRGEYAVVTEGLIGCIKDIRVQNDGALGDWWNASWTEADHWSRAYTCWQGCPINLDQESVHFLGRGYLGMSETFGILHPTTWSVQFSFRSSYSSGTLFYAAGSDDSYLIALIHNSTLRFMMPDIHGEVMDISVDPSYFTSDLSFCDGSWHKVTIQNTQLLFTIEVDGSIEGSQHVSSTNDLGTLNLEQSLYLGGLPHVILKKLSSKLPVKTQPFGGCMKELKVNDRRIDLQRDVKSAVNVDLDGCPREELNSKKLFSDTSTEGSTDYFESTFATPIKSPVQNHNNTCIDNSIETLYSGLLHVYLDASVDENPFTRYLYKVISSNAGGEAQSEWMVARSGVGIPETVPSPFNEISWSGREVQLEWRRPIISRGVIVNYTLSAVKLFFKGNENETTSVHSNETENITSRLQLTSASVINTTFDGDVQIGNISGLSPWTTYTVAVTACTLNGCATSAATTDVTTLEEIPASVEAPTADVNATSMTVEWLKPKHPNGRIISYTLYHNNTKAYIGLDTQYHIPGLPIFTPQIFRLEACTIKGCNFSKDVTLYSGQLPPGYVDQPMVTVTGPHSAEVRWLEPAIMNGIFQRYILYLRDFETDTESPGEVVYNSTDRMLMHTLNDLIAGTRYHVTLSACTQGGCKLSVPTPCQTKESVPEDVPPPDVFSPDPYSFNVSWGEPKFPNGIITLYSLYQNEILIHNSTAPSSTIASRLTPWSRHTFRLKVCTKKGCSFGPAVTKRTKQSPPEGNVELQVSVLNSRTLEAYWSPPERQNGRMMYSVICVGLFYKNPEENDFSMSTTSRIMLNTTVTSEWTSVIGLIPDSEYTVKVNASNGAGYVISSMRSVSMPPGAPDGVLPPTLASHTPHSILVSWKDPARNNAPGNSLFQLEYRALNPPENEVSVFDSMTRQMSYHLTGLKPYKAYEFQLVASNEHGATHSEWTSIYTMQAKPSFMEPPIVFDMDAWSLHVTWEIPSQPNGIIEKYKLYQNDNLREEFPGNVTEFRDENLTPFTAYWFRVEACTEAGCTLSNDSRRVRTSATAPEGLEPPTLRSDTPASVFATWKPPALSNGILDSYRLERRPNNTDDVIPSHPKLLGVFAPSQSLRFLDMDDDLRPYTAYQYRVICSTLAGGATTSEWSTVRTRAGRPEGVMAPTLTVIGSETILVEWDPPTQSNGPIKSYEISFPEPLIRIDDIRTLQRNVTDLIPYKNYEVSITACTTGGCTESPSAHARTEPAVPRGLDPPIATPISERSINVQWKPPSFPNGPEIRYELSRTILSQPLLPTPPSYINITENIYSGTGLLYVDRDLDKFTTCEYRVSVFNELGSTASNGTIVTTWAGYPTSSGQIDVAVHNHTSVLLWWEPPDINELQGNVVQYVVRYNSSDDVMHEKQFPPNVTSWKLSSLHPGTTYQFVLDIDNGPYVVTSSPVYATTDDGAPEGVSPPVVYPLSPSQLRVSWLAPQQPNGQIVAYNIIIDDAIIHTNLTVASAYIVDNLRPYTVYSLKLEVCTVYACAVSNVTKATTKETNPVGIKEPTLKVSGKNVEVKWKEPALPNGILRNYQVLRRSLVSCNEIKLEETEEKCNYVTCGRGEGICATTCFSPLHQVCCDGVLHPVDGAKECCGTKYIALRKRPSDVCCGGKFMTYRENHECCSGRYLKVNAREVCCRDPLEDRVSVGIGDSCCGGVPYINNGLQLCCNGELYDAFGRKCCGGEVINSEKICCGNSQEGTSYAKNDEVLECCGTQYLPKNTTLCCHDKPHQVENATTTSKKCCSTELIASDQSCCNGEGFDPNREICADEATASLSDSSMPARCGTGTICPIGRAMFAGCDRCDFDREKYDCFRILLSKTSSNESHNGVCPTSYIIIYSGLPSVFSYYDNEVEYFTKYQYKIVAKNKVGAGESIPANITTPQAAPGDVYPPEWTSEDRGTILLTWRPPKSPNGIITQYALLRDGLEIWSGLALRHTDTFEILSYREYEYILRVCTHAGCTNSDPVRATSIQGIPQFVTPPRLLVTGPSSILITWTRPSRSNGVIGRYILNETENGTIYIMNSPSASPQDLRYEYSQLKPYTSYTFSLTACTSAGCTSSDEVSATTNEAPPDGVWQRSASLPLNKSAVELFWTKPLEPNGEILEYRMLRKIIPESFKSLSDSARSDAISKLQWDLAYVGEADKLTFTDQMAGTGARAHYQLMAVNGAGVGRSGTHVTQLPKYVPASVAMVSAKVLGSTSVELNWSLSDNITSRDSVSYQIVAQKMLGNAVSSVGTTVSTPARKKRSLDPEPEESKLPDDPDAIIQIIKVGKEQSHIVNGLAPFTTYNFRIRTCLSDLNATAANETENNWNSTIDCNVGSPSSTRTLSAAPGGQSKPVVKAAGPTSVDVSWKPPSSPNGRITEYRLYRRQAVAADGSVAYEKLVYYTTDSDQLSYTDDDRELRPYTKYQYQIKVSNDVSETESGWSDVITKQDIPRGMVKPRVEAVSAFAVRARWEPPASANGVITNYRVEYQQQFKDPTVLLPILAAVTAPSSENEATFSGLRPYTDYKVRIVAVNQALLEGRSDWSDVTTLPAPPSEVANLTAVATTDGNSLLLSWDKPAVPNGEVETYKLYEVGFEDAPIYSGLERQFLFRRLSPYTEYRLVLEACTGRDLCSRTAPQTFRTAQTVPESQPAPVINFSNATAIVVSWSKPPRANGKVIGYYVVRKMSPRSIQHSIRKRSSYSSNFFSPWFGENMDSSPESQIFDSQRSLDKSTVHDRIRRKVRSDDIDDDGDVIYEVIDPKFESYNYSDTDLLPYTRYGYKIRTSTEAGSVDSDWVFANTHQAAPEGVNAPDVIHPQDHNPTSLIISWKLPDKNNGVLQTFRLQRNATPPLSFPATQFRFTDQGLLPYTVYAYTVTACTGGGCTTSDTKSLRTYEEAPLFVAPPSAIAINSTTIRVSWELPKMANGIITQYRLHVDNMVRYEGLKTDATISDLDPFRWYDVTVEACTNSGCRESESTEVRTHEAPPTDMPSPELHVTSPNSIEVIWQPPKFPNGDIVRYEVFRNDELVYVSDGIVTRYHDFGLKAGTEYHYDVVAFNKRGSTRSKPPVAVETDPSVPSGLAPPSLTATSSSTIHTKWDPPAHPNGLIVNYTLYVRHTTDKNQESFDLSGSMYSFDVRGLEFFEEYLFWLRACTELGCSMSERALQRTLEAPPTNQMPPRVSLPYLDQLMLAITWSPPLEPNGIITGYILKRQRLVTTAMSSDVVAVRVIANVTEHSYTDFDLFPYTQYQYQVISMNEVGEAPSPWSAPIRSSEAPPEEVPAPTFYDITSHSVRVVSENPLIANGVVRLYHVYMKQNQSSAPMSRVSSGPGRDQIILNLLPFTTYQFEIEACTLETMCTKGPSAYVTTLPAPPNGQNPPTIVLINPTNISLSWSTPEQPNGVIRRYEIYYRKACPLSHQPFPQECAVGFVRIGYSGRGNQKVVGNLLPHTRYEFRVTSYNDHGNVASEWENAVTAKSEPVYVSPFSASSNISVIAVKWPNSFVLNSVLIRYELSDRGKNIYTGVDHFYNLKRTASQEHEFQVVAFTDTGSAQTPYLLLDTTRGENGNGILVERDDNDLDETVDAFDVSNSQIPFYQTVWFILTVALGVIVIVITALVLIIRRMKPQNSYRKHNAPKDYHQSGHEAVMGMNTLSPYNADHHDDYHNHGIMKHRDILQQSRINRSFSADSLNHSYNHLMEGNSPFHETLHPNNDDTVRFTDKWGSVMPFDDREEHFHGQHHVTMDTGPVNSKKYFADDDSTLFVTRPPIKFVDTHI